MSVDFDGRNDVYEERIRRARKDHVCAACHEPIRRGDRYASTFVVYDGTASQVKRCMRCDLMFEHLCERHRGSESGPELELMCGHSYQAVFDEEPPPEIARLAFFTPAEAQAVYEERRQKKATEAAQAALKEKP
jgi:hypothetical protein